MFTCEWKYRERSVFRVSTYFNTILMSWIQQQLFVHRVNLRKPFSIISHNKMPDFYFPLRYLTTIRQRCNLLKPTLWTTRAETRTSIELSFPVVLRTGTVAPKIRCSSKGDLTAVPGIKLECRKTGKKTPTLNVFTRKSGIDKHSDTRKAQAPASWIFISSTCGQ